MFESKIEREVREEREGDNSGTLRASATAPVILLDQLAWKTIKKAKGPDAPRANESGLVNAETADIFGRCARLMTKQSLATTFLRLSPLHVRQNMTQAGGVAGPLGTP